MRIVVQRKLRVRSPAQLVFANSNDWRHFAYIHRRSHALFKPLIQMGGRCVFLYRARILFPIPIFQNFLVVRQEDVDGLGYQQIYLDLNGDVKSYLRARCYVENGVTVQDGRFVLKVPWLLRWTPGVLVWIFARRMKRVADEDGVYLKEAKSHQSPEGLQCQFDDGRLDQEFNQFQRMLDETPPQYIVEQDGSP